MPENNSSPAPEGATLTPDRRVANARGHLRNAMEHTDDTRALIDAANAVIADQAPVLALAIDHELECFEHLKDLTEEGPS